MSQPSDLFARVLLEQVGKESGGERGKAFAHTVAIQPGGERLYDGLLYMDGIVYRLGLMSDGGNLHGFVDEHIDREQQRADFAQSLKEVGLTPEQAEAARCEINLAIQKSPGKRVCKVPEGDLQAIIKTLESGLCQEALRLVKRLLVK